MELTLANFVFLVLLGSFALVAICALVSRSLHHLSERRSLTQRVICRLCQHAFEVVSHEQIVHCPHCGAANEKGRSRRLG